jgi:arylsulfatase A-like enzyme
MNTLIITLDAVRRDHLSQYGYERDTLPAADRLVETGGVTFNQAIVNGTYTGISLPSLLTSRHDGDRSIRSGPSIGSALPDDVRTGAIHSNTFFASKFNDIHGMDVYEDFVGQASHDEAVPTTNKLARRLFDTVRPVLQRTGLFEFARTIQEGIVPASLIHEVAVFESAETTTDRALEFIRGTNDPFCLWVHYMDPHRPYAINADSPTYGPNLDRSDILDLMAHAGVNPETIDDNQRSLLIDLYDSAIRYTSEHISRLFDGLVAGRLWDDTSVILTADHGEEFGEHGLYFHRNHPYDELVRVPMFMKTPDGTPNLPSMVDEPRELLDIAPTVCRLHGVEPPAGFLGTDLRKRALREPITRGSFASDVPVVAIRADGYSYIDIGDDAELYDLAIDPGEQNDVSSSNLDKLRDLRAKIPDRLFTEGDSGVPEEVTDDARQRLEELGYLD